MKNTFKILFYAKRKAPLRNGNIPIMGRITINGDRTQFSTCLSIPPGLWDVGLGRASGRSNTAIRFNEQLSNIRYHVERSYNQLFHAHAVVTPLMIKEMYFGVNHDGETILAFFKRHNDEFSHMVGVNRSKTTYLKYRCVCGHLADYIRNKYDCNDLPFRKLDREFLTGFHSYIVNECGCRKNTTWIYMIALKHIFMLARSKGHMSKDLFANYRLHSEAVTRNYLCMREISKLMRYETGDATLQLVRDAFIFSCFTGLSYIDVCNLTPRNIRHINKQMWITTTRRKTGSEVHVRLFSVPYNILLKYLPVSGNGQLFRLPSNGWCNKCLDKITVAAGINTQITFHAARHTFATTITLSQGVAIETISKLLGHKNIRTTQIYANITHSQLSIEMERLSKRINSLYPDWNPSGLPDAMQKFP